MQAFLFTILWMSMRILGAFLLSFVVDAPLEHVIFETASALSVVGLSVGITDPENA
ncbi:MAG: hypothetical protein RQ741_00510 [Wenzhouxiangellaceae bacterium]|nr:hypothetical protein [Wenzhouxiangellaceae bacterium]